MRTELLGFDKKNNMKAIEGISGIGVSFRKILVQALALPKAEWDSLFPLIPYEAEGTFEENSETFFNGVDEAAALLAKAQRGEELTEEERVKLADWDSQGRFDKAEQA